MDVVPRRRRRTALRQDIFQLVKPLRVKVAVEDVARVDRKQLVTVSAYLVEETNLEEEDGVSGVAVLLALGVPARRPARALAEPLALWAVVERLWRLCEDNGRAALTRKPALRSADLPLEVPAEVVGRPAAVQ